MLKIIISGINGKIGSFVYDSAVKNSHQVVSGIDKNISGAVDCPVYSSFYEVKEHSDVIIDFSSPQLLNDLLDYAKTNKTPLVIGTTGYSQEQENQIIKASKSIPIFKSANTSLGINLILKLSKILASALNGFDIEILDKHHKYKKDSPSGTAKMIYSAINETLKNKTTPICGRHGNGKRKESEIGIHSLRGGTVVGEHSVFFFGENETITLTHTANSKQLFAFGAIRAAEFIYKNKVGLYNMDDLLST
ncbi:MAG: 4-hydroxy-tetrahydrodipicolinate reductase [Clostridia bacterium]|nr:4-hydroxy-tetrahydrodipicolinate reductase [Clostridia bacterium]MBQ4099885.1 4-hydroxy-tetrahydrodipicolinate reductase [Clostridia bacterium]